VALDIAARCPGLDHAIYIERKRAPEKTEFDVQAVYIEDAGKVEKPDLASGEVEGVGGSDTSIAAIVAATSESQSSIFSNISPNPKVRKSLWPAVHRCGRTPRMNSLLFALGSAPEEWLHAALKLKLPRPLRRHLLRVKLLYLRWRRSPDLGKRPFKAPRIKVTAEQAGEYLTSLGNLILTATGAKVSFKSGLGERVQYRIIGTLPAELSAEARARIVRRVCQELLPEGTMYTGVVHAPDARNDARNYHFHVIFYDRPCTYLLEYDCWDFEYTEESKGSRGRTCTLHPLRRPKIAAVTKATAGVEWSGSKFFPSIRNGACAIVNDELVAHGFEPRFDVRSLKQRGIDEVPTKPLGSRMTELERVGLSTPVGEKNAQILWSRHLRFKLAEVAEWHRQLALTADEARAVVAPRLKGESRERLDCLLDSIGKEQSRLRQEMEDEVRMRLTEAMVRSRAAQVVRTCERYLKEIADGSASRQTRRDAHLIEKRLAEAKAWLVEIDEALAPYRDETARAARSIEARKAELLEAVRAETLMEKVAPSQVDAASVLVRGPAVAPAPLDAAATSEDIEVQIRSLLRIIGFSHKQRGLVGFKSGKAMSLVANSTDESRALQGALDDFAEDPRVRRALTGLADHLGRTERRVRLFDNLILDHEAVALTTSSGERAKIRAALGRHQTLFAARDGAGRPCLSSEDAAVAETVRRLSNNPCTTGFVDALFEALGETGEISARGHVAIVAAAPLALRGRGRSAER
jgi:hypothetical protein